MQVAQDKQTGEDSPPPRPFRTVQYFYIAIFWFNTSFLWGGFLSVVLPALNEPLAVPLFGAEREETARGIMTALGIFIAMVLQPLAGSVSDVSTFKMGRRRPHIIGGVVFQFAALALVAWATNWWLLLAGYLLLQVFDNWAQGAYQGLMPDIVPEEKRGVASAALSVSQLAGTLVGAVTPGILQDIYGKIPGSQIQLFLVAIVAIIATFITVLGVKETRYQPETKPRLGDSLNIFKGITKYPDYLWLIFARLFFLMGPASVSLFVAPFLEKNGFIAPTIENGQIVYNSLGRPEVVAGITLSILLGLVIIGAVVAAYPAAMLSEKIGRKRVIYVASVVGFVGAVCLLIPYFIMTNAVNEVKNLDLLAQQPILDRTRPMAITLCVIFGALVGTSWGAFMSVDWAYATDLVPLTEAGRFMGLLNVATAGCQAVAAFVGGLLVDSSLGYVGLLIVTGAYFIVSAFLLRQVRETRGKAMARKLKEIGSGK
jgi:MFS family permease